MVKDNELVTSYDQVVANVVQYNRELDLSEDVVTQVAQTQHWYYIPTFDMFGPSKYIGYKDMNCSFYNRGHRLTGQVVRKSGFDTEPRLSLWFRELQPTDPLLPKLQFKLESRMASLGKHLRKSYVIHVPKAFRTSR